MSKNEFPQLVYHDEFYTWSETNEEEITCIFAENGADRELDFDREKEEEELYVRLYY